jgi:hypothetical protein
MGPGAFKSRPLGPRLERVTAHDPGPGAFKTPRLRPGNPAPYRFEWPGPGGSPRGFTKAPAEGAELATLLGRGALIAFEGQAPELSLQLVIAL